MSGLPAGYGLTAAGFVAPDIDVILDSIEADIQNAFGAGVDLSSMSNFGQFAGSMAERFLDLWNLGEAVYTAQTAEGATGTAEDSVNSLTGCIRLEAVASTVALVLTGTNGTVIGTSAVVSTTGQNGNQFGDFSATLVTAPAWTAATSYVVGNIISNSGNIYYCTTGGVSAGGGGPSGTGSSIPDGLGTLIWAYAGSGLAFASVPTATALLTGPLTGPAGTVTVIVTPISGWNGVWNPLDAIVGTNVEVDSAYRIRRDAELGENGKAYLNAIRAAVLLVGANTDNPVTACTVFENYTDTTSVDGIPPHAVECLVQGGDNLAVATAIFDTIAAGIQPFGQTNTVTETVLDSVGNPHTVQFSRPNPVDIYVTLDVTVNPESPFFNPSDGGAATISAQVVSWGNGLGSGFDVTSAYASAQAFVANVGAWNVTGAFVGTAPSPGGSEVIITARELPTFDTAWVVINITQATP